MGSYCSKLTLVWENPTFLISSNYNSISNAECYEESNIYLYNLKKKKKNSIILRKKKQYFKYSG